ncbi:TetR/AcrR family transcriptional regulator [Brevibacterium zhoupengii]|uniref:TetR/AcrR family transcriptional regulator n=1 Tax=Brevibacterium zhoupengii TaxID=2898795 RepID=UPI001E4D98D4|nr:TetR family transcriptional regulator [Brevibacterium zhoupengii]
MISRRILVADTAIGVVATAGLRGLTHRAVDDFAGLPVGSTSNCYSTRNDLVTGIASRIHTRISEKSEHARASRLTEDEYGTLLLTDDRHLFRTLALFSLDPSLPLPGRSRISATHELITETFADLAGRAQTSTQTVVGQLIANVIVDDSTDAAAIEQSLQRL